MDESRPFVIIPYLPPTSNHIYVTGRGGIRFLSKEAKTFKARTISLIQTSCLPKIAKLEIEAIYKIRYDFFFPNEELINKTYNPETKEGAQSRYKRMDVENRLKLLADAFSTAVGIDDSKFFKGEYCKLSASLTDNKPQVHIYFEKINPESHGL